MRGGLGILGERRCIIFLWAELCLGFEGAVVFFFFVLLFFLFHTVFQCTLKILGGIALQTHTTSAKKLLYLKQTSGESESFKSRSHMIAQWLSSSRNSRSPSALLFHIEVLRCQGSCFCLKPQFPFSDQLHVLFLSRV